MRLLVVEDDPDLNRQLVSALSDAGYAVDTAFDGEEGHFLGDTEPYDAVLLDLGLPITDGISVLRMWRAAGRTWEEISELSGMSVGGARKVARRFPDILKTIQGAHQLRILTDIEKATETQLEIAEDKDHRRCTDAYKNLITVGHPKESSRSEIHVGDKYEDNRQATSVTIENVEHLSMEELKAKVDEHWQRYLRPPAP